MPAVPSLLRRRSAAALLLLLTVAVVTVLPGGAAQAKRKPAPATPPPSPAKHVGVSTEGAPGGPELQALVADVGAVPDEVMWFVAWSTGAGFPTEDAVRVRDLGATPVITWEPWDPAAGSAQTAYSMRSIAAGEHDGYLRRWARGARGFGGTVVLRFAHEMNGTWYPWSPGVAGTTTADVVGAWRRVRDVLAKERAGNVVLRWSPNVPFPGSTPLADLWPGSRYVGQVGLDGYNWAGHLPGTSWLSFGDVVGQGLDELAALTSLPVHVSETATPERAPDGSGDKPAWIRGMFASLRDDPRLAGITWFHHDKELDWRITSSAEATAAFREGMAAR